MKIIIISAIWCPSCLKMGKIYKQLKEKYNNLEFISYDLDFDEEKVNQYNPGDILPILIIEKNNQETKRIIGEHTLEELEQEIEEYFNNEK